ncbi:uncharacterized protein LOC111625426 [Centruroides sculpturatus]|uniref:uncharacterized protein LOC111625426 n=1 Tax=Centruroides sculpturatus TaxID=218467 RepID=UPI000C6D4F64|nr:uncharacterized protein LOC111625426 [Centruroides sculpturatus]
MFHSFIAPVFFYASPVWALDYYKYLEKFHIIFLRKVLHIERTVPGYAIRSETNRFQLFPFFLKCLFKFYLRILNTDDDNIKFLFQLISNQNGSLSTKNVSWYQKFVKIIQSYGISTLLLNSTEDNCKHAYSLMMNSALSQSVIKDQDSILNSTYHYWYQNMLHFPSSSNIITTNTNLNIKRTLIQIRLNYNSLLIGNVYIDFSKKCYWCKSESFNIYHILIECPKIEEAQCKFKLKEIFDLSQEENFRTNLEKIPLCKMYNIHNFFVHILKILKYDVVN